MIFKPNGTLLLDYMKKALITGITGQDGSYLAELLLKKGYDVYGIIRRASLFNTGRIDHIFKDPHIPSRLHLLYGDMTDSGSVNKILRTVHPDEIYNLAAQSHVKVSFDIPEYTSDVVALGTLRLLDGIREMKDCVRFYQASSSEMFGSSPPPQNEKTVFRPRSPYACAKVYAYWITVNYRESYGLFTCNGVLFNHESPRRGQTFVTRKITRGVADILAKKAKKIYLGNIDAKRDWGFSPEYVENMWKMLQLEKPDDFVIGMGQTFSVKEFLAGAFSYVGLEWEDYVEIDPRYFRPVEPETLISDSRKAEKAIGWKPKVTFEDLIKIMVDADMRDVGLEPIGEGDMIIEKKFPDRWWKKD